MARLATDYQKLLQSLMPKGAFWTRDPNSNLANIWLAVAQEYKRIDDRSLDLITERQVQLTTELVTEHEEDYGLPEKGDKLGDTLADRRSDLYSSMLRVGQQNEEYFEEIAEALGYTIEIEEYQPFWAGYNGVNSGVGNQTILFYWTVLIDATLITESKDVNINKLMVKIKEVNPAHTTVLFEWYNVEFGRGFSSAFSRKPSYDNSWLDGQFNRNFDDSFANNCDYDGINYTGSYGYEFSLAFDRRSGGDFFRDEFSVAFTRPS